MVIEAVRSRDNAKDTSPSTPTLGRTISLFLESVILVSGENPTTLCVPKQHIEAYSFLQDQTISSSYNLYKMLHISLFSYSTHFFTTNMVVVTFSIVVRHLKNQKCAINNSYLARDYHCLSIKIQDFLPAYSIYSALPVQWSNNYILLYKEPYFKELSFTLLLSYAILFNSVLATRISPKRF